MRRTVLAIVLAGVFALASVAFSQNNAGQGEKAKDPVCNMMVVKNPELSVRYGNTTYYFCMKKDMVAFQKDPEKYLRGSSHTHPDPNS